jgi:hypothetical protein
MIFMKGQVWAGHHLEFFFVIIFVTVDHTPRIMTCDVTREGKGCIVVAVPVIVSR